MKRAFLPLVLAFSLLPGSLALAATLTYPEAIKDAEAKARNKDYSASVLAYEEALKLAKSTDQTSSVYYYIANTYRQDKKTDKAIEFMTKSVEVPGISDSRKAMAAKYLGDLYLGEGKNDLAREWYAKVKGMPGAHPDMKYLACFNTGRSYSAPATALQARAAYEEILQLPGMSSNQLSDAYHYMALTSFTLKNLPQAQIDLDNSLKLEGISEDRKQRARVGLAGLAKSQGRIPDAIKAYEDLLADKSLSNGNRVNCNALLADLYATQKPPATDKAKACLEAIFTVPGVSGDQKRAAQTQLDKLNGKAAPAKTPQPAITPTPATQPAK